MYNTDHTCIKHAYDYDQPTRMMNIHARNYKIVENEREREREMLWLSINKILITLVLEGIHQNFSLQDIANFKKEISYSKKSDKFLLIEFFIP